MPDLPATAARELAAVDDALAGRPVPDDLAAWGELTRLLRAERPAPDPAFATALDARAARGFAGPSPAIRAARRRPWRVRLGWPGLGLVAAALLVGVVVALNDGGARRDATGGGRVAEPLAAESAGTDSGGAAQDDAGAASAVPDTAVAPVPPMVVPGSARSDANPRRTVERSATLTLAAPPRAVDAVSARIQATTRRLGGFVAASTVSSGPLGGGGSFTLRIPSRNLDAAVAALAALGDVRERSQSAQDITAAAVSTRRRLREARIERAALLRRLATATTANETESLRRRLDIVGREIERARAARRRVANRGAFATVALTLMSEPRPVDNDAGGAWTPRDAAGDALRVLEVAAGVGLIALALGLPLGALAALAVAAARWSARRRRERLLDAV
jgi:hypothetical protein